MSTPTTASDAVVFVFGFIAASPIHREPLKASSTGEAAGPSHYQQNGADDDPRGQCPPDLGGRRFPAGGGWGWHRQRRVIAPAQSRRSPQFRRLPHLEEDNQAGHADQ